MRTYCRQVVDGTGEPWAREAWEADVRSVFAALRDSAEVEALWVPGWSPLEFLCRAFGVEPDLEVRGGLEVLACEGALVGKKLEVVRRALGRLEAEVMSRSGPGVGLAGEMGRVLEGMLRFWGGQ